MRRLTKLSRRSLLKAAGASSVAVATSPTRGSAEERTGRSLFRVLSLDGGGVRGFLTASILAEIEAYVNQYTNTMIPLGQRFDLIVGTSTGGIIEIGLAYGFTAREIMQFYEDLARKVFAYFWLPRPLRAPKYSASTLAALLETRFGRAKVRDIKTDICVTSVALSNGQPRLLTSDYLGNSAYLDHNLSEIALATSAAPTYFPSHTKLKHGHLVDGGLCANNPSMIALVEALGFERDSRRRTAPPHASKDILLVSVGTGKQPNLPYDVNALGSDGLVGWGLHVSDVIFASQAWLADYQAKVLLSEYGQYLRIDRNLPYPMELDDPSHLNELRGLAVRSPDESKFIRTYLAT